MFTINPRTVSRVCRTMFNCLSKQVRSSAFSPSACIRWRSASSAAWRAFVAASSASCFCLRAAARPGSASAFDLSPAHAGTHSFEDQAAIELSQHVDYYHDRSSQWQGRLSCIQNKMNSLFVRANALTHSSNFRTQCYVPKIFSSPMRQIENAWGPYALGMRANCSL